MKITRGLFITTIFVASISFGQIKKDIDTKIYVNGFDISKDDKNILLASGDANGRSIYIMNSDSTVAKLLIKGTKNLSFFNPEYSPDEKKIVFIGFFNRKENDAAVFIANSDGTGVKQITKGNEIIKQAIFSKFDSSAVIYIKAGYYGSYSSIGVDQAHEMDIYSVNLKDHIENRITYLKEYELYNISELDTNTFLFDMLRESSGGLYLYNKITKELKNVVPKNSPFNDPSVYHTPKYSKEFNVLGFIAPYEFYIMDIETKIAKRVYRSGPVLNPIQDFCFFHNSKKVLFEVGAIGGLNLINFDGTDYKKINIVLEK